ncbi:hypothetical protein LN736_12370 [Clostridium sp. WLY-B-L2]|uniref:Major facilitator superfamily (MFS) profile domain-containing protein n=1 Tax=Clostridium aromativorans TaxID=2836848 RepID=A0ABS8N765_9CLOT|nr:MFS transporter [Clostridium aromativorans]MCC9295654.1 hypothetical protein [Clostridium aromativorans]CAB1249977.1 hypothetical protein CLOSBL3_12001 [Clostridiaceae bacterium BL-3]
MRGVGFANAAGRVASIVTPPIIAAILTTYGTNAVFATVLGLLVFFAVVIGVAGVETMGKSLEEINKDVYL